MGAAVGFFSSLVSQLCDKEGPSIASGEFWAHVGVATATGAISGAVAASGVGLLGQIAVNSVIGSISAGADAVIEGETNTEILTKKVFEGFTIGMISGMLGGRGSASKHVTNSWKKVWKTHNWSYYFGQIKTEAVEAGWKAIPSILKSIIPAIADIYVSRNSGR